MRRGPRLRDMPQYDEGRRVFLAGGGVLASHHVQENAPYGDQPREAKAFMAGWFDAFEEAHGGQRRIGRDRDLEAER